MRYITILLIITFSFFIVSLAQDTEHSHSTTDTEYSTEHNSKEHSTEHSDGVEHYSNTDNSSESESTEMEHEHSSASEEHSDDTSMTEHTMSESDMSESSDMNHTSETSNASHDHNNHNEHSDNSEHGDHSNHTSTMTAGSANSVMLGDKQLTVYPLLSPQGIFQIIVQSDSAGYVTSASFEGKSQLITFDEKGLTTVDLGSAKHGSYTLTFRDDSNVTTVPVNIYKAFTPSGKAFTTIFAPSPSLSSKGQSEVFIYNIADGEYQHQMINVNYSMQGMQHSLDNVMTPLAHEHFDSLKAIVSTIETSETTTLDTDLLDSAMSNRSALSFAMAGVWQFSILVDGEVLTFDIEMLAD